MKISQLPQDSSPAAADYLAGNQASGPTTQRFKLSDLATFMWTLANIPSGQTSPITRDSEMGFAFVASGFVWSGDSYGVNRNASMTAGVCYINGRRISISAVTARTFTASKDTYIDVLDNGDGTGTLVYTEVTNNAASPALASNSIRIGIIVTGATTIAAAGSVNQGSPLAVLPIASSIAYSVTDSLGNLIYPTDPNRRIVGYRQITASLLSLSSASSAQLVGLSCPVILPSINRKVVVTVGVYGMQPSTGNYMEIEVWKGTVGSGTQLNAQQPQLASASAVIPVTTQGMDFTTGAQTYNAGYKVNTGGNVSITAASTSPAYIRVELE